MPFFVGPEICRRCFDLHHRNRTLAVKRDDIGASTRLEAELGKASISLLDEEADDAAGDLFGVAIRHQTEMRCFVHAPQVIIIKGISGAFRRITLIFTPPRLILAL